jgi:cytochrome P450
MTDTSQAVWLRTWHDAREAFRARDLRQGLYEEAGTLMQGVIVNLHGEPHKARRRLENRLFRRDTFRWYETDVIPPTIDAIVAPALAAGQGDLLPLARRTMMKLACVIAGVDVADGDFDDVFVLMNRLARASTSIHATGGHDALRADGLDALAEVDRRFIQPSLARRSALVAEHRAGRRAVEELPRDVLTTLLLNQDALDLPPDVVVREVAYFPWVGSHSTSNAFVHAMHHLFQRFEIHPGDRERLLADELLLQRFVHESLRLHPASPETHRMAEARVELSGGRVIEAGARVIVDMNAANRDPAVWGPTADEFDPFRAVPADAAPWGYTFGHGVHACLGMELAGGLEPDAATDPSDHLYGAITTMARILLGHGARPDPDHPYRLDTATVRVVFAAYPVRFGKKSSSA